VMAASARLGAAISWDAREAGFIGLAFAGAVFHNNLDVISALAAPVGPAGAAGAGCGASLSRIPAKNCEQMRNKVLDIESRMYNRIWLGPDYDPEELVFCGKRERRCIRLQRVWATTEKMIRHLAHLGLPRGRFVPNVSEEILESAIKAQKERRRFGTGALSRADRKAFDDLYEATAAYNMQFELQSERLGMGEFLEMLRGMWPAGYVSDAEGSDGQEESDSEGSWETVDSDDEGSWDSDYGDSSD